MTSYNIPCNQGDQIDMRFTDGRMETAIAKFGTYAVSYDVIKAWVNGVIMLDLIDFPRSYTIGPGVVKNATIASPAGTWTTKRQGIVSVFGGGGGGSGGSNQPSLGKQGTIVIDEWYGDTEPEPVSLTCIHEYVNVGFTSIIEVCKKCNKDKKEV